MDYIISPKEDSNPNEQIRNQKEKYQTYSLEPVYGIVFAVFPLGEVPSIRTIIGGLIMLGTAFLASNGKVSLLS